LRSSSKASGADIVSGGHPRDGIDANKKNERVALPDGPMEPALDGVFDETLFFRNSGGCGFAWL
jgi:hypothetical protein